MDLNAKTARAPMESVHPLATAGTLTSSPTAAKKSQPKGVPISVPTNQRRLSNFSLKTANRALMTGYRDGGSSSARRKSSVSSQGHISPPFFPHKDDFDIIGTVPGFERLVEAEAQKHKGKMKATESVIPVEEDEHREHKPVKRKKIEKESGSDDLSTTKPASSVAKGRRKSSSSLVALHSSQSPTALVPTSPSTSGGSTAVISPPTITGASMARLKHISGFRAVSSSNANKSSGSAPMTWPQMPLSCVRVWPAAEFMAAGMTVQFGADRFSLTIRRNSTKVPYSELKAVNFHTASTFKIFQFSTFSKLAASSVLARGYDPAGVSDKASMITLFIDASASSMLSICTSLKQKGVDVTRLTPAAAEEILAADKKRLTNSRPSEHTEEALFVYPFNSTVKSKSIAVRAADVSRLNDGEFLNDTLIEFGLKYAQMNAEVKSAALAGQVYIFNTFLYQRLVTKPAKGFTNSYDAIKSWTAKVDIFSMKYIIVPIHENMHWYLAIITNPGLLVKKAELSPSFAARSDLHETDVASLSEVVDGASGDESKSPAADSTDVPNEGHKALRTSHINVDEKPYILCLDSLGGSHLSVFSVLRSYLQQELLSRKGISATLSSKDITGKFSSKCPRQDNLWDCGIYLLHYTEVFLRNPTALLDAIVNRTEDKTMWLLPELASKRAKYKEIMIALSEQYRVYQFHRDLVQDIKGKTVEASTTFLSATSTTAPPEAISTNAQIASLEVLASIEEAPEEKSKEPTPVVISHRTEDLRSMDTES